MTRARNTADTQTASGGPVPPNIAGKNAIINGGMDVWQRGTTSPSITTTLAYTADRWGVLAGASTATVVTRQLTSDTTNLPTVDYCARVQRTAGQTGTALIQFAQSMESLNSFRFAGQSVTLSFYARAGANYSSASNALNVLMLTGTGTDEQVLVGYTGSVTSINSFATLTTTWQRFTFTATLATNTNEIGMDLYYTPSGTAGANDYFEVTGIQLEQGYSVSTFSRSAANYSGELAACQRYYWRNSPNAAYGYFAVGYADTTTSTRFNFQFPVTMRTAPTAIDYGGTIWVEFTGGTGTNVTTLTMIGSTTGPSATGVSGNASGFTQYRPSALLANNSSTAYVGFSAEL